MDTNKIESVSKDSIKKFKQRKSKIFYEAAVSELLETHSLEESKKIMLSYLNHLDEI